MRFLLVAMVIGYIQLHSVAESCHCLPLKAHFVSLILFSLIGVYALGLSTQPSPKKPSSTGLMIASYGAPEETKLIR